MPTDTAQYTSSANVTELPELRALIGDGGVSVLFLAAQMAVVPVQQTLLQWVFEQSGQDVTAEQALALCEQNQLALMSEPGLWQLDCELAAHIVTGLSEQEQQKALELKNHAVRYLLLAVEGEIEAPLVASDLEHIRFLSAYPVTDDQCDLLVWLADFAYQNGDSATSADSWQGIYEHLLKTEGDQSDNTLVAMNNLAESLRLLGELDEARELYKKQVAIYSDLSGPDNSATLTAMINLAAVLRQSNDLSGARVMEEQVVESRSRTLGETHPDTLSAANSLASTLKAMGDLDAARNLQSDVLHMSKAVLPVTHPLVTEAAWNLSQTMLAQDDYDSMQDIIFDDLFWLMDENADIQTQSQDQIRAMLTQLLSGGSM